MSRAPAPSHPSRPLRVDEVIAAAPTLARLAERARLADALLRTLLPALPAGLRHAVQAGPVEGSEWCLLVQGSPAAAKLRQLLPDLVHMLRQHGHAIDRIRLRLVTPSKPVKSAPPQAQR